jgi:hypothetical protein
MGITHAFTSAKSDTGDATLLQPSNWNADHTVSGIGMVLLEQHTASNSATLDFTSAFTSTYDEYMIELLEVLPATNAADFQMLASIDGGSNWLAGTNYHWNVLIRWDSGIDNHGSTGAAFFTMTGYAAGGINNTAAKGGYSGSLRLFNPLGTTAYKRIRWEGSARMGDDNFSVHSGAGEVLTTSAVNAIQYKFASGNIASGTIRVYGIPK